jgi:hypothetical protein
MAEILGGIYFIKTNLPYQIDAFLQKTQRRGFLVDAIFSAYVEGAKPRIELPWSMNYAKPIAREY